MMSNLLLCERAKPARAMKSRVSSKSSSKAMAKASGVNDMLCAEIIRRCNCGPTNSDTAELFTRRKKPQPGLFMYARINPIADNGFRVRGVDNRVHMHIGDVVSHYFKWHSLIRPRID